MAGTLIMMSAWSRFLRSLSSGKPGSRSSPCISRSHTPSDC